MKRFVVTGCSRSGTQYASSLFRTLGVRCGHEDVFGYHNVGGDHVDWNGYDADASWLALPFLPLDDVVVLHQVRHPLDVVRSLVGIYFLADWKHWKHDEYLRAIHLYAPEVVAGKSELERAALHWRIWNERAETHASITYRLEDLEAELVLRLAEWIDLDTSEAEAKEAIERTPRNVNARQRDETISWDEVAPLLGNLPGRYGY